MPDNILNNQYKAIETLKETRSGKTFIAEDIKTPEQRRCVIKQLDATAYAPEKIQRLHTTFARAAEKLKAASSRHSQVPTLYDYFTEQGVFYWVQAYVEGRPLKDYAAAPWSEAQVVAFLNSALKALNQLHRQNIVHLNLKPSNIIIRQTDRHPCLAGIGAKALMAAVDTDAIMVRTSGFTAPEQTMGKPVPASDIYSLGMIAIRLLSATPPLKIPTDKNNGRLLWQTFVPNVDSRLAGVLTRAIHSSPGIRFANAAEMLAVLSQSAGATAPAQSPVQSPVQPPTQPPVSPVSPTEVAPRPAAPLPLEATTVSPSPLSPVSPPPAPAPVAASAPPPAAATVVEPKTVNPPAVPPKAIPSQVAAVSPSPIYNSGESPSGRSRAKFPFLVIWFGLLFGAIGLGAAVLLAPRYFAKGTPSFEASSPENLAAQISEIEDRIDNNPNDTSTRLELAEAYTYGGNLDAAAAVIDSLIDDAGESSGALYQQGRLQFFQSDYTGAISSLEEAASQDARHGEAVVMLGRAYQEVGDYEQAEEQFTAALRLPGQKGEAQLNLSKLYHLQGDTRAALDAVNAADRFFQGDDKIRVHTQRSALYFDLRDRENAQAEWEAAIALSPRNPEAYVLQSISHFFLGDSEGAIASLEQALAINPNFTEAYAMESMIHLNQGNIEPAITAIDEAVAIDEYSISALKIIADVALSAPEPNPEFALTAMDQALSVNPNNPYILNQRCSFMLALKDLDAALDDCTRSIEINPNNVEAHNSRGQAYLALFDFTSAEAEFTRIIEIDEAVGRPPDAAAYAQRAAARTGLADTEGAKADLDRALEINSED